MKLLFATCMMIVCPMTFADTSGKDCEKFARTDEVSSSLTIDEIEKQAMTDLLMQRHVRPEHPNVLFGYANAHWLSFKSMFQSGDKIVSYSTNRNSWKTQSGHRGFAMIRAGCIITRFVEVQS